MVVVFVHPLIQGPITTGEVITVLPFGNTLATIEVTGAELKQAFETSFGQFPAENGGFLHVSGAKVKFRFIYNLAESVSYRLNIKRLMVLMQQSKLTNIHNCNQCFHR